MYDKIRCSNCGRESILISSLLNVCVDCIRKDFREVYPLIEEAHRKTREEFTLPLHPPQIPEGKSCKLCVNQCQISPEGVSFCGLRKNLEGKLEGASSFKGYLDWYYDPLPTNCVADWVCAGGTGDGYPKFAHTPGAEYGYKNLAVFYRGCSFNCLFCQNWHWRDQINEKKVVSPQELASFVDTRTSCICFFGGDPSCQITHSLETARIARKKAGNQILRICWETNGSMSPKYLDEMIRISLESGGCIKFDLKAWHEEVNIALCGVTNKQTLENFKHVASFIDKRVKPPLLIASTLLIPGYIDEEEVRGIAHFITSLNPEIPYTLLAFSPQFYMQDLPTTSKEHAKKCKKIAEEQGVKRVRVGNIHLLSDAY